MFTLFDVTMLKPLSVNMTSEKIYKLSNTTVLFIAFRPSEGKSLLLAKWVR